MTIYEMLENYKQLFLLLNDPDEEIDEQSVKDTLEAIKDGAEDKLNNYGKVIVNLTAQADALESEGKRLVERGKTIKKRIDFLKAVIQQAMDDLGEKSLKTSHFSYSIRTTKRVVVDDLNNVPPEYVKVTIEPKKTEIGKLLKQDGSKIAWAHLEESKSLSMGKINKD